LLAHFPETLVSEWDVFPENRYFPPAATALTEVVAQDGDRLVIEIGFRAFNTSATEYIGRMEVGDPATGTDLPENETETGQKRGWLEFSQNLVWMPDPYAVVGSGGIEVAGDGVLAHESPVSLAVVGSGGAEVGGDGTVNFEAPGVLEVIGEGGVKVGGKGAVAVVFPDVPPVYAHEGAGGCKVGGEGVIEFILPASGLAQDLAIVGSGGVEVSGAGVLDIIPPPVLAVVGSGGVEVGDFRVPELTTVRFVDPAGLTLYAGSGPVAVEVGGAGVVAHLQPEAWAVPATQAVEAAAILVGGQGCIAFITPQAFNVLGEGEIMVGAEPVSEGTCDTYVLTGFRNEPSLYSNFNFNSYARHQGKFYGAKEDGVYLLEGEDDAGAEIHPGVRIGPANFGSQRPKRLRSLRLGGECANARVRVSNGNGSEGFADVEQGVATVPREVQGREITIDIADFESLNHLEIVPMVLARR
jgi:hypothetical protein